MSRAAMRNAARLPDGTIIPTSAVYRTNRFTNAAATYAVHAPWLPQPTRLFDSREEAIAAIIAHHQRKAA